MNPISVATEAMCKPMHMRDIKTQKQSLTVHQPNQNGERLKENGYTMNNWEVLMQSNINNTISPLSEKIKFIELGISEVRSDFKRLRKVLKKSKRRHSKRSRKISDSDSSSDEEEPRSKRSSKKSKTSSNEPTVPEINILQLPHVIIGRILYFLPVTSMIKCETYLTCKTFYTISDSVWRYHFDTIFNSYSLESAPWMSFLTQHTNGIFFLSNSKRGPYYIQGFQSGFTWRERYRRMVDMRDGISSVTRLLNSHDTRGWIKSCNIIPCVIIDPELGMVHTTSPRVRYTKRVFNGSHEEKGKPPVTVLYILINRPKETRLTFECKVVFVDKKTEAPATKKTHRNDVFEGIMRMLQTCSQSNAFDLPYWDPLRTDMDKSKTDQSPPDYAVKTAKDQLKNYYEKQKNDKTLEINKVLDPTFTTRPYLGLAPIEHSANDSGYVIITPGTFEKMKIGRVEDPHQSASKTYFRSNSLWKKSGEWYLSSTRYILSYKCCIPFECLQDPLTFMSNIMSPRKNGMSPLPLSTEELTMDLKIMHGIMLRKRESKD